jgi:membrane protein implicated in regulation of membrane protease activity
MSMLKNQDKLKPYFSGRATIYEVAQENQCCRVMFKEVSWRAKAVVPSSLRPNGLVEVVGREGLSLLIKTPSTQGTEKGG